MSIPLDEWSTAVAEGRRPCDNGVTHSTPAHIVTTQAVCRPFTWSALWHTPFRPRAFGGDGLALAPVRYTGAVHDDPVEPPPLTTRRMLASLAGPSLPPCGAGHLFRRWFTMAERCLRWRFRLERIEGHWIGAPA